jgi:hypothetical protein
VVLGAALIVVVLVLVIPIAVFLSGGVAAGLLGHFLKDEADGHGDEVWRELNY